LDKNIDNKTCSVEQYKLFISYLTLNKAVLNVKFKQDECDLDIFTKQIACEKYEELMSDLKGFCVITCYDYQNTLIYYMFEKLYLKIINTGCYLKSLVIIDDIKNNNVCVYINDEIIKKNIILFG